MTEALIGGEHRVVITRCASQAGHSFAMAAFSAVLPASAAGRWCRFSLRTGGTGPCWVKLEIADSARGHIVREAFFPPGGGARKSMLMHLPFAAGQLTLSLFVTRDEAGCVPALSLRVLGRAEAGARLFAGGWHKLPCAMRGRLPGVLGRVRAVLGQGAARAGEAPPYSVWIDLYDRWAEPERQALLARPFADSLGVAIVATHDARALARTLDSVAAQWRQPACIKIIRETADWHALETDWVVILGAGEILPPHALACLAVASGERRAQAAFCADLDLCDANGVRSAPGLRPPPDPWLMRSDFFADGAWMFHRGAIDRAVPNPPSTARAVRLALANNLPASCLFRVPLILTHVSESHNAAPPPSVRAGENRPPKISILVPSACRSRHVLHCLRRIALGTDYADYEILIAVSSTDPADRRQARIMRRLAALPYIRLIDLAMPIFNFAAVINKAAAQASGALLLLLNDDVAPIAPDWLSRLAAFTQGEGARADIVGARLLYGNGLVQHAGVIMGLANLCEHAFRLAAPTDPGPRGLAHLDRQVSAVTAACMLVRTALFRSLGGLDEGFAIALNDVDFCARAGQAGARIVIAAGVDMYHFESLSLGRHYQGARAGLEACEVHRLRDRWASRILADPFYHPCASLEPGREFCPGFPPRQTPLSWIGREAPARD